jgi:hypothetical protein
VADTRPGLAHHQESEVPLMPCEPTRPDRPPAQLASDAAELVRAANHATINPAACGMASAADVYDTVAALYQLASRLPQLCAQLAKILATAATRGSLTGPPRAPEHAAAELRRAAETLTPAVAALDAAWQTLGPVGGWLGPDTPDAAGPDAEPAP